MKAMVMTAFGDPKVLEMQDLPDPTPGDHDLLIKVLATAVNPVDCKTRQAPRWGDRHPPMILGFDVCGEVVETGSDVQTFAVGDTVFASPNIIRDGANAEFVCVDARTAAIAPSSLTPAESAALPLASLTAWESLHEHGSLQADHTVLIHAGAGGVGHIAIQLAKAAGARVLTTAGYDDSIQLCTDLHADHVINYRSENVLDRVMELTDGKGCELVLDTVGGEVFNQSIACLRHFGSLVTIVPGVPGDTINDLFAKCASIHFEFMGCRTMNNIDLDGQADILKQVAAAADTGTLRPHISKTYSLDQLPEAHTQQESGRTRGKLSVTVG